MPRPEQQAMPREKDFKHLIDELSGACEHLWQQNCLLIRENSMLRGDFGGDCTELMPQAPPQNAKVSSELPALAEAQPVWKAPGEAAQAPDGAKADRPVSAWRAQNMTSASGLLSAAREQFNRLDVHAMGRLYITDLERVLRNAKKPIDRKSLTTVLTALNHVDGNSANHPPFASAPSGLGLAHSESLCMDVHAFARMLDRELSYHHLGPNVQDCINCLREACHQEALEAELRNERAREPGETDEEHADATQIVAVLNAAHTPSWVEAMLIKVQNFSSIQVIPASAIFLHMLVAGLSVDHPQHVKVWDIFEYVFATWYTIEFSVKLRYSGCRNYFFGCDWAWNNFDFLCLLLSWTDPLIQLVIVVLHTGDEAPDLGGLALVKMARLCRLARLIRILRFEIFVDLKQMIMGVFAGLRVLTWAVVLLVMLIYVFGIGLTHLIGAEEEEFNSVLASMSTLFRCWTEGCSAYDGTPLSERLRMSYGSGFFAFHILATMFVTVGLFNLIMATFIDNVVRRQHIRNLKELGQTTLSMETRMKKLVVDLIGRAKPSFFSQDTDATPHVGLPMSARNRWGTRVADITTLNERWEALRANDTSITKGTFKQWLEEKDFQELLDEADIEAANALDLFDVLDANMSGALSMDELTTGLMKLRGPVTKADIVAVRLKVRYLTRILESSLPESTEVKESELDRLKAKAAL